MCFKMGKKSTITSKTDLFNIGIAAHVERSDKGQAPSKMIQQKLH